MNEKQDNAGIGEERKSLNLNDLADNQSVSEAESSGDYEIENIYDKDALEDRPFLQEQEYLEQLKSEEVFETVSYPEYMKNPEKYAGRSVVVTDVRLDRGDTEGFSVEMQKKFGWRKEGEYSSSLLKDYEKKHGDYEHPGDYFNERGAQARLANLVKDPKEQEITPDMVRKELYRRAETVDTYGEIKQVLLSGRDEMISELFGKGNPLAAYKCFLDKEALKNGVYTFDRARVQGILDSFSNVNLAKDAKKIYKKVEPYDSFKYALKRTLGVSDAALGEEYSSRDVLNNARANARLEAEQLAWLGFVLAGMKQLYRLRGFTGLISHPIDYFREWRSIREATRIMTEDFRVDPATLEAPPLDDGDILGFEVIRQSEIDDPVPGSVETTEEKDVEPEIKNEEPDKENVKVDEKEVEIVKFSEPAEEQKKEPENPFKQDDIESVIESMI